MSEEHFIVQSVAGVLMAICGKTFPPRLANLIEVGQRGGTLCSECARQVAAAWITVKV